MKNLFRTIWLLILGLLVRDALSMTIISEKTTYHSAELMNLSLEILSNENAIATVSINGINNKLNMEKQIELIAGRNFVNFEYNLPRCNVCGGINPGNYTITSVVETNEHTANDSILIKIVQ